MNCPGQLAQPTTTAGGDLFFFTLYNQPMYLDVYNNGGTPAHTMPNNSQSKAHAACANGTKGHPAPNTGASPSPAPPAKTPPPVHPSGGLGPPPGPNATA